LAPKQYRAAAIGRTGQGNFGHGMHLPYKDLPNVDYVAISDPDEAGRKKAQAEAGVPRSYADWQEMLQKEKIDVISVGPRWVDCHEEMIVACVNAGCHVYCEKPMAANPESADRIVAAADKANRKVAVAHQGVYLAQIQEVKQQIEAGRIGKVLGMVATGKQDRRGGGEDMLVLGTHLFNMMRYFAGDPDWMTARVTANGRELGVGDIREAGEPVGPIAGDWCESFFSFKNGVRATYSSQMNHPGANKCYGLEIHGENGRVAISGNGVDVAIREDPVWAPWSGDHQWHPMQFKQVEPLQGPGNRNAVIDLLKAAEENREPVSSASAARAALEMIVGAYEAQLTGKRVSLPLLERTHPLDRLRARG